MARGRPPKPLPELLLKGTFRHHRHGDATGVWLPDGSPIEPTWLDSEGRWLWQSIVKQLAAGKIASDVDSAELAAMCDWWSRYRAAAKAADKVKDRSGMPFYRLSILASMAWKNFTSAASKFGLNPSDRARLKLDGGPKPEDELLEFAKRRG